MKLIFAFAVIALTVSIGSAERGWVNNITVGENEMTWSYTETFTETDSQVYRVGIDEELGNNNSFVNAWELLKIDREMRNRLRNSIEKEMDVKINNQTEGIEVVDIESVLSPAIIGKTHTMDAVENKYAVTYRLKNSIYNASSIWFLGQAGSPVTIILPEGIDVLNISGMDNVTYDDKISGFFKRLSGDRGEITIIMAKNASFVVEKPEVSFTSVATPEGKNAEQVKLLSRARDATVLLIGVLLILLIYVFKVRKK